MFEHEHFDTYSFDNIPLDRDIYVMEDTFMAEYETMFHEVFNGAEYRNIGIVNFFAARTINDNSIEMSWYPNVHTRFHEVVVSIPKDQFITCVGSWYCDEPPRIFVKSEWVRNLHGRNFSIFCMIDAIGVKKALEEGAISSEKLATLRNRIDTLAVKYEEVSFISFADNILLKSNWTVGFLKKDTGTRYNPEIFLHIIKLINEIYNEEAPGSGLAMTHFAAREYCECCNAKPDRNTAHAVMRLLTYYN